MENQEVEDMNKAIHEMKKCPFCGAEGTLNHYPGDGYLPMCTKCDGMVEKWFGSPEEAVAAWNRRFDGAAMESEVHNV